MYTSSFNLHRNCQIFMITILYSIQFLYPTYSRSSFSDKIPIMIHHYVIHPHFMIRHYVIHRTNYIEFECVVIKPDKLGPQPCHKMRVSSILEMLRHSLDPKVFFFFFQTVFQMYILYIHIIHSLRVHYTYSLHVWYYVTYFH